MISMDVVCVHVCVGSVLPMNDPVLQIRLKKQLSGGRAPHLLQEGIQINKYKYGHSEILDAKIQSTNTIGK